MSFGSPWLLLFLLVIPIAIVGYVVVDRRRSAGAEAWSTRALLPNMVGRRASRLQHLPALLVLLGLTFLLVGFARPQRGVGTVKGGAPVVVLTFDVSGSMTAADVAPTRIRAARALAADLLSELPANARVAVVTFGERVNLLVAPTFDRRLVLASFPTAVTPRAGTRIGDGINQAVSAIIEAAGKGYPGDPIRPGAILVLSDGAQTGGGPSPLQAANTAYLDGIEIDAVAIGTHKGFVTQTEKVDGYAVPNRIGVSVFPPGLTVTTKTTGGKFLTLTSPTQEPGVARALSTTYRNLSSTTVSAHKEDELTSYTAAAAVALIAFGVLMSALWFGRYA